MEIPGNIANKGGVGPLWQLLAEGRVMYVCVYMYICCEGVCGGVGIVCVWGGVGCYSP